MDVSAAPMVPKNVSAAATLTTVCYASGILIRKAMHDSEIFQRAEEAIRHAEEQRKRTRELRERVEDLKVQLLRLLTEQKPGHSDRTVT